jgi:hypothetical protein
VQLVLSHAYSLHVLEIFSLLLFGDLRTRGNLIWTGTTEPTLTLLSYSFDHLVQHQSNLGIQPLHVFVKEWIVSKILGSILISKVVSTVKSTSNYQS